MKIKNLTAIFMVVVLIVSLVGCQISQDETSISTPVATTETEEITIATTEELSVTPSILDTEGMFSNRDLEQGADLSEAEYITLESDDTLILLNEGVYILTGHVTDSTIVVEADDASKVQLVLDDVTIVNKSVPAIYVKSADKVFVTTTDSTNSLEVSGTYKADGDTYLDSVIFSKSDLVLNGIGILEITSIEGNGVTSKDDLKVTGGTLMITADADGLEANDSIRIYDGNITILTNKDGLHSENDDDQSLGYIYIQNGLLKITAKDDAIHGTSVVQIDGGTIDITTASEGIEATYIIINQGIIDIYATDDGINATSLSNLDVVIEVNGGDITIVMADGDTDGFDANGDIYINGGHINVTAESSFDADGNAVLSGGIVTVNDVIVTELPASKQGRGKH